jgi:hypothetical protein
MQCIMQYENTIPKRKISENLFGPREGCVGPDYSASLSHLFLSLNHMHLSFLASDFLHPIGLSDFGMAQVPAQQEDDMSDSAEDMNRRKECPKLKEIESTCKGRLIKVSNVRGAKMGSWGEDLQRG